MVNFKFLTDIKKYFAKWIRVVHKRTTRCVYATKHGESTFPNKDSCPFLNFIQTQTLVGYPEH